MEALIEQMKCLVVPPGGPHGVPQGSPLGGSGETECNGKDGEESMTEMKLKLDELKEKVIEMLLQCGSTQTQVCV